MEKKKRQSCCKLKVYPNISKLSKKTGLLPFYVKLTFQKKKVEFRLYDDYDIKEDVLKYWDEENECIQGNSLCYEDLNIKISEIKLRFKKYMRENNYTPKHSLNEIMAKILELQKIDIDQTVIKFFEDYYNDTLIKSNAISDGTKRNYNKSINHYKNFSIKYGYENMLLSELKYIHTKKFQTWLGSEEGPNNLPSSASGLIKNLKHIMKEAVKCELINKNPFDDLKLCYKGNSHTSYLTIQQVKQVNELENGVLPNDLQFYKDLFIYSCYTGLSVCDLQKLSKEDMKPVFNTRVKVDSFRKKTNNIIVHIVPKQALDIMEKYSGMDKSTLFPKFCPYTYNKKLKLIGAYCGLNINLTTKIARTTCMQMLINVGYINDLYQNVYMGWSNSNDIREFYYTIEDNILLKNTVLIEQFLDEHIYTKNKVK